jgi:preprotein translocase subunit SecG
MFYLLITLIILACVLLVFVVLIQNPKGGGLASNFSGSNNLMGVKRTGDILEKGTWVLVISIMVFSLMINVVEPGSGSRSSGSDLHDQIVPTSVPAAPTTSPITTPVETPADTSN